MHTQPRAKAVLAAGAAVQLLTGIPAAWGVFQKPVMEEYGFARGQATLAFALLVAAYGLGCLLGGWLQDAKGPRPAGLLGAALLGGGFVAAAFVPAGQAAVFWLAFSLPAGLGSAFLAPSVLACVQKWYADKKDLPPASPAWRWDFRARFSRCLCGWRAGRSACGPALARWAA